MLNAKGDYARAIGDGIADDTAALNRLFAIAREAGNGTPIYIPHGRYRVTTPINAGGFGNTHLTVSGDGAKSGGGTVASVIDGDMIGGVVVDFSGNEGAEIRDLQITSHAGHPPAIGLLLANAAPNNRGGLCSLRDVQVAGEFTSAAIALYSADLCTFYRVNAGTDRAGAVALYVVNGYGITPVYSITSPFRTLSPDTGITHVTSFGGVWSPSGGARAAWLIHNISGVAAGFGDSFVFGGVNAFGIETLGGAMLDLHGLRHEAGPACSFLRVNGSLKNSHLSGNVQKSGAHPLVDLTSGAILSNTVLRLAPSNTGAHLIDTSLAVQIFGCDLWLMDGMALTINGAAAMASGNRIYNVTGSPGVVTLPPSGTGNLEVSYELGGRIKLDGKTLSAGVIDSGGTGFRCLRVPN